MATNPLVQAFLNTFTDTPQGGRGISSLSNWADVLGLTQQNAPLVSPQIMFGQAQTPLPNTVSNVQNSSPVNQNNVSAQPQMQLSSPPVNPIIDSLTQGNTSYAVPSYNQFMPQQQTGWGDILKELAVPLATAAAGIAIPGALPGAAGFQQGFSGGKQQAFENKLKQQEQDRLGRYFSDLTGAPDGFEITGYDQKGQPMIRKIKRDVNAEKFDYQKEKDQQANEAKTDYIRGQAQETLNSINEVLNLQKYFGLNSLQLGVPGSEKFVFDTNLSKLLSSKMIDLMTKMKEASKTGATGFGQLSEKEGQILRDAATSLKAGLPKDKAVKLLSDWKNAMTQILAGGEQGQQYSGLQPGHIEDGYIFKGGDPGDSKNWEKQ